MHTASVLVASLVALASAKKCTELKIPVDITAKNTVFDYKPEDSEISVTDFFLRLTRQGDNYPGTLMKGVKDVSGQYELAATYCEPDAGPGETIQILTHGVGFDRSYWDYSFNNYNYSYVNRAIEEGYSTLAWDRLGIAESSHGEPVNEIQAPLEIAALKELTQRVHDGNVCGLGSRFKKFVHIGHSFGSIMTYGLSTKYPNLTDAIVLTGFSQAQGFIGYFALGANFVPVSSIAELKGKYGVGYFAPRDSVGVHTNFFGPGDFDPEMLKSATKNGQPATFGELLTTGGPVSKPSNFGGHVLIITGDRDVPFCGGDCKNSKMVSVNATNILEVSRPMFRKAKSFNATIVPDAGHGLNFGYSHTVTYKGILDFLHSAL